MIKVFSRTIPYNEYVIANDHTGIDQIFTDIQSTFIQINRSQGEDKIGFFGTTLDDQSLAIKCTDFIDSITKDIA
jgi:hypothetical protein